MEEKIGRYKIIEKLGKGAMGKVYLAHDPQIDRRVAIKTIIYNQSIPEEDRKEAKLRFLREAKVAGKLIHPNIVTIFDVGEENGMPFIAMEYIPGETTLREYTRSDSLLTFDRIINVMVQTCEALDYAHGFDLVHRDIKPANLMLTNEFNVKITDFGLAKNPNTNLTQAGTLLGTPSYMSPEQIQEEDLDGRTDIFSLGVVFYELLTGDKPFPGDSVTTIMYRIMNEDPREPTLINSKLPSQCDKIIEKALSKDPDKRFQSGEEFKNALLNYQDYFKDKSTEKTIEVETQPDLKKDEEKEKPSRGSSKTKTGKKKRKTGRKIFLAVLILILAVTGIYWYAYYNKGFTISESVQNIDNKYNLPSFIVKTITTDPGKYKSPSPIKFALVQITTDPPYEKLTLKNHEIESPLKIPEQDNIERTITASKGCKKAQRTFKLSDLTDNKIEMKLKEMIFDVMINTEPPKATVKINGTKQPKTTPFSKKLSSCKEYELTASKKDYKTATRRIKNLTESKDTIELKLESQVKPGYLLLNKSPGDDYDAEIRYRDEKIGTVGKAVELMPGYYKLDIVNEKYLVNFTRDANISQNKTSKKRIDLPSRGTLKARANPSNAKIKIRGKQFGTIPFTKKISVGTYELTCIFSGDQIRKKEVEIQADQTTTVTFSLE